MEQEAKRLVEAIESNLESCKEEGIGDTGSFVRHQYIAEELEELKRCFTNP